MKFEWLKRIEKSWLGLRGGALFMITALLLGSLLALCLFPHLPIRLAKAMPTPSPTRIRPTATLEAQEFPTPTVEEEAITPTPLAETPTPSLEAPTPSPTAEPIPTPTSPPPPSPPRMNSPEYGMQAFLWWRPETAWRDLDLIKGAGFTWVKQVFAWIDIEGAGKGGYDWSHTDRIVEDANSRGLDILTAVFKPPAWLGPNYPASGAVNNYRDFTDFLTALATRYKGRIRAYSIWNEPNLSREWGGPPDPEGYVALLKVAYQTIKAVDPNALVITAGLSPTTRWDNVAMPDVEYFKRMYQAGAKSYFDLLGAHATGWKAPPEMDPAQVASDPAYNNNDPSPAYLRRVYCFRHAEDIRQIMVDFGDAGKQIAVLEFGWTSDPIHPEYSWFAVTEEQKGEYLVRAYQYAKQHWAPWIGVMTLIYISDPDWTQDHEQYWWAITDPDGTPRPAYVMLSQMTK